VSEESYKKFRPKTFKTVAGQAAAVQSLEGFLQKGKIPHFVLFSGPSGVGKTTLARILATKLNCGPNDLEEINCASFRGVDTVRDLQRRMGMSPLTGPVRVFIVDESHQLTKDAQNAFLKILEDTPSHVYFMMATTEPDKLLPTIRTRATHVQLKPIGAKELTDVVTRIAAKQKIELTEEILEKLIAVSEGSARKALVLLDQIAGIDDEETALKLLTEDSGRAEIVEICRELLKPKPSYGTIQKLMKTITDEPETIRRAILGYMTGILSSNTNKPLLNRAYVVVDSFRDSYFESGKAGLWASYWLCINGIDG
jgi:DNA polymerase III delta prime subunit